MSLVFSDVKEAPQTHVFIIGVGGYPFLRGGALANNDTSELFGSLGQLTTSPFSALSFLAAVMQLHQQQSWIKPLGSVELLLSPAPGTPAPADVESATIRHIQAAYDRWYKRCDADAENVAIFYFCGHGLEKDQHYLLTEDFHERPQNPWDGAFNIDKTRLGFNSCQARTKLFLIDACRLVPKKSLQYDFVVQALDMPKYGENEADYFLFQKAAAPNEAAFGRLNGLSFYTEALISALKGAAAENDTGFWQVGISGLAANMLSLMRDIDAAQDYKQRCTHTNSDTTDIIRLPAPPQVILQLYCDPEAANAAAAFSCIHTETKAVKERAPAPGRWNVPVEPGIHRVSVRFGDTPYKSNETFVTANPPKSFKKINCL